MRSQSVIGFIMEFPQMVSKPTYLIIEKIAIFFLILNGNFFVKCIAIQSVKALDRHAIPLLSWWPILQRRFFPFLQR